MFFNEDNLLIELLKIFGELAVDDRCFQYVPAFDNVEVRKYLKSIQSYEGDARETHAMMVSGTTSSSMNCESKPRTAC